MSQKKFILLIGLLFFSVNALAVDKHKEAISNEIIVTAQKTEEKLKDVPVSVSVIDDIALDDQGIRNLEELAGYVPNFYLPSMGDWGVTGPSMRGLNTDLLTMASSVGMYIDGVPTTSSVGYLALMNDVERVEVLRGPQGSLYGKNAEAGVVNIITKKPDNKRSGSVYTEIGKDNKKEVGLSFRSPLVRDKFYIGLTGRFYEKDGYLKNTYLDSTDNDRKNYFGKVFLRSTPNENLDVSLIFSRYKTDDGVVSQNLISAEKPREFESDVEGFLNNTFDSHSLSVKYKTKFFLFESISGYKKIKLNTFIDNDFSGMEGFHSRTKMPYETWSEELRLSGEHNNLKWLFGVYGDKMEKTGGYNVSSINPMFRGSFMSDLDEQTLGIFTHFNYLVSEKISAVLGLRYDWDEREVKDYTYKVFEDAGYSCFSPKMAVQYKANKNFTAYMSVSKGYKSGGFYIFAAPGYSKKYEQETLWNYEVGAKTLWLDGKLMLNTALFYMDISDMQVVTQVNAKYGYVSNAASATSAGMEFEGKLLVSENLSLFANFGFTDSKFDSFIDSFGDYKDNHTTFSPEYNYSVGFKYRGTRGFFLGGDIRGYGKSYLDKANKYSQGEYTLINLKTGYEWDNIDFYIYGKNIFDEKYDMKGYSGSLNMLSDPGEIGVRLAWRF